MGTPVTSDGKAPDPSLLAVIHNTNQFGRGKRNTKPVSTTYAGVTLVDTDESSDDEISIISEKITPKTKLKLMHKQKHFSSVKRKPGMGSVPRRVQPKLSTTAKKP